MKILKRYNRLRFHTCYGRWRSRPRYWNGETHKVKTPAGFIWITVNVNCGLPVEVFIKSEKPGNEVFAMAEALGKSISAELRAGVPVEKIISDLVGIRGGEPVFWYGEQILSLPDGVGQTLAKIALQGRGNK